MHIENIPINNLLRTLTQSFTIPVLFRTLFVFFLYTAKKSPHEPFIHFSLLVHLLYLMFELGVSQSVDF